MIYAILVVIMGNQMYFNAKYLCNIFFSSSFFLQIVIFDLNKKQMMKSQGDEGTILPKEIQKALKTALNMCKVDAGIVCVFFSIKE